MAAPPGPARLPQLISPAQFPEALPAVTPQAQPTALARAASSRGDRRPIVTGGNTGSGRAARAYSWRQGDHLDGGKGGRRAHDAEPQCRRLPGRHTGQNRAGGGPRPPGQRRPSSSSARPRSSGYEAQTVAALFDDTLEPDPAAILRQTSVPGVWLAPCSWLLKEHNLACPEHSGQAQFALHNFLGEVKEALRLRPDRHAARHRQPAELGRPAGQHVRADAGQARSVFRPGADRRRAADRRRHPERQPVAASSWATSSTSTGAGPSTRSTSRRSGSCTASRCSPPSSRTWRGNTRRRKGCRSR